MIYALKLEQNIIHYYYLAYYLAYEMENGRKIIDFLNKGYIENHPNFVPILFSTKLIARLEAQTLSTFKKGKISVIKWTEC